MTPSRTRRRAAEGCGGKSGRKVWATRSTRRPKRRAGGGRGGWCQKPAVTAQTPAANGLGNTKRMGREPTSAGQAVTDGTNSKRRARPPAQKGGARRSHHTASSRAGRLNETQQQLQRRFGASRALQWPTENEGGGHLRASLRRHANGACAGRGRGHVTGWGQAKKEGGTRPSSVWPATQSEPESERTIQM